MSTPSRSTLLDVRALAEAVVTVVVTWLLLGRSVFGSSLHQQDGKFLVDPLMQSALSSGADWTEHAYRFGVLGGSKMHEFAGSLPIVQVCGALGLGVSATSNVVTVFIQVCFAFCGLVLIQAMRRREVTIPLTLPVRIAAVWLCGFAPVLGWRLAVGHENLLLGLLPLVACFAMLWSARAGTVTPIKLVVATFAVANGVSGLGAQMVVYGAIFGAPLVLAVVVDAPRGSRWGAAHWLVVAALAAGVLLSLPRVWPMLTHATGPDATRSLDEHVTYSYWGQHARDYVESLPWTQVFAERHGQPGTTHERNVPIGPLLVFVPLLWHRRRNWWLGWALVASAAFAIVFALRIEPISSAMLRTLPPLSAFRVPARAIMAVAVLLPPLLVGALLSWRVDPTAMPRAERTWSYGALAIALAVIVSHATIPVAVQEALAWLGCTALCVAAICRSLRAHHVVAGTLLVAGLGTSAFIARFDDDLGTKIEHGPAELRAQVLAQVPSLEMPLARIEIVDPPPPWGPGLGFATGLSTLDGVWYPPRRFLTLLSTLTARPVASTTAVFSLGDSSAFPVLQQLYNVTTYVRMHTKELGELPRTPGAAWFPAELRIVDQPSELARALVGRGDELHAKLAGTGWLLRSDAWPSGLSGCADARVINVRTDALGQRAVVEVTSPRACTMIISTNYVSTFAAFAEVAGARTPTPVFPIDIALTGVAVPAGATRIDLEPQLRVAAWTRVASLLGWLLLLVATAGGWRLARRP